MGATFCGSFSKNNNNEDLQERLGESSVSSHITYTKNNLTNVEEFRIDVTVRNVQKMKFELKGMLNMKLK